MQVYSLVYIVTYGVGVRELIFLIGGLFNICFDYSAVHVKIDVGTGILRPNGLERVEPLPFWL